MSNREEGAIAKIIEETQTGKLKWRALDLRDRDEPIPAPGGETRLQEAYLAKRGGRFLRIYTYLDKYYTEVDEWRWTDHLALDTAQYVDSGWWTFPSSRLTGDLLRAVQYQVNDVGGLLDDLLGDDL